MLSVIVLSVVMLNAIMPNVLAPFEVSLHFAIIFLLIKSNKNIKLLLKKVFLSAKNMSFEHRKLTHGNGLIIYRSPPV